MNRLRRNWLLMLDEPRYRGLRTAAQIVPAIDGDTLIIDISPQVLQIDVVADTLTIDLSPGIVTIG